MTIVLLLYCLLFLTGCIYVLVNLFNKHWSIEVVFLSLFGIFYVFVPINIIILGHEIYDSSLESYMIPTSRFVSYYSFFITLTFLVSFCFGSKIRGNYSNKYKIYKLKLATISLPKLISYFLSLLSGISLLIYIYQYGGLTTFAANLTVDRAGLLDQDSIGSYTFVGRFIDLAIIPLIFFLYFKHQPKINSLLLLFLPVTVLIVSNLFISVSKLNFVGLGLLFYFTVSLKSKKIYIQYLLSICAFVFFALPILDDIFILASRVLAQEGFVAVPYKIAAAIFSGYLGKGEYEAFLKNNASNTYFQFLEYFTYIQISLQFSISNSYHWAFFADLLSGIINLLPARLNISPGLEVQQLNTAIFYGYYPKIPELNWGVPPGIIGFGMYNLSVTGVILTSFILGYVFRAVDLFFQALIEIDKSFSAFYAYMIFILGCYSTLGLPKVILYNFVFLVFLFIFFVVSFKFEEVRD